MEFYSHLYVGESIKNSKHIVYKLTKGLVVKNKYIITLANGNDLLDIYDARLFSQSHFKNFDRMIVGIAGSYDEALELVLCILKETLDSRKDCNAKEYLISNMIAERQE